MHMEKRVNRGKAYTSLHASSWSVSVLRGSHYYWVLCVLLGTLRACASVYVYVCFVNTQCVCTCVYTDTHVYIYTYT